MRTYENENNVGTITVAVHTGAIVSECCGHGNHVFTIIAKMPESSLFNEA